MATEIVQAPSSADDQGMTLADRLAHEAGSFVRTPLDVLRKQIARLENSLRIQREARTSFLVTMRNPLASELERAEAEGFFRTTVEDIAGLRRQLAEYRAELAAVRYTSAESRANELIHLARTTGRMSDLNADDLAHYVDLMAGAKATLADAGALHLIGGAA